MNTKNKGFSALTITLLVVAGIIVIGAGFYAHYLNSREQVADTNTNTGSQGGPMLPVGAPIPTSSPVLAPSSSAPVSPTKKPPIYPASGPIGATITLNGSGFAATGNIVTLNGLTAASLKDIPSADGKTIKFAVPEMVGPNCKADEVCAEYLVDITVGTTYDISVISNGVTQELGPFTVNGGIIQ